MSAHSFKATGCFALLTFAAIPLSVIGVLWLIGVLS